MARMTSDDPGHKRTGSAVRASATGTDTVTTTEGTAPSGVAETTGAGPDRHDHDEDAAGSGWPWWPVPAMLALGAALVGFMLWSHNFHTVSFGWFRHPPLYGAFIPVYDEMALRVIPAGILLAGIAWVVTSTGRFARRIPTWLALGAAICGGVVAAAAVAVVRGDWEDLIRGISMSQDRPYYTSDLHFVYEYGVRGFVERHPDLVEEYHAYNSKTHPAGVHLVLYGLFRLFGSSHPLRITTAIALLALTTAVAAWLVGRTLGGERAGRISAVLLVAAPGPLLLAYTGLDLIYAVPLSLATALLMLGIHRQSAVITAAGGAMLAVGTLLTYATVFIALATAITAVIQTRSARTSLRLLASAAGAGLAVIVLARVTLGFDIIRSYQAVPRGSSTSYDPYWIVASPAAWLIWAGLPLAVVGIAGVFAAKGPRLQRPVLPLVLMLVMVTWAALPADLTLLRPGEVERTWAFLYPLAAGAAGPLIDRWTRGSGWWRSGLFTAGLVIVSVAQAAVLQSLWENFI